MVSDPQRETARRVLEEAYGQGDLAVADELVAEDLVLHTPLPVGPEALRGREGFKEMVRWVRGTFPDARITVDDAAVEGKSVGVRATFEGTHLGALHKYPPSGRRVRWTELFICHVSDGQLKELWHELNVLGIIQQIGELPPEWEMGRPPKAIVTVLRSVGRFKRRLANR